MWKYENIFVEKYKNGRIEKIKCLKRGIRNKKQKVIILKMFAYFINFIVS